VSKKIWASAILFTVLCALSPVYAMDSAPPPKDQEIAAKMFAPGTYKTYKNNELGFSFKYPKNWYLNVVDEGFLLCELTNFDPEIGLAGIPEEKLVDITISATRFPDTLFPDTGLKNEKAIRDYFSGYNSSKPVREMDVKGGKVYLIKKSLGAIGGGKEFDLAYLYFSNIKDDKNNWDYVIRFLPFRLGNKYRDEYFKLLRSIEIINK